MMKKLMNNSIALVSMITILFFACSKENPISEVEDEPEPEPTEEPNNQVPEPTFDLLNSPVIEKVVDDQGNEMHKVSFQFSGEADKIDFWSGQSGHDYQYRDGRVVGYDALNLSFDVRKNANSQQDNFSVHVSTNFNGEYTFENVSGADWTDITGHFNIPIPTPTNSWIPIEPYNIIAHKEEGKPLYVAFKYTYYPQSIAGTPSIWRINPFKLSAVNIFGEVEIGGQTSSEWKFVSNAIDDNPITRSRIEGTSQGRVSNIFFQYGNNTVSQEIGHETWCVSKAFELNSIDMGTDQAITIKESVAPALTAYQHHYTESGTYEVVFVATNIDGSGGKEVVKTVQVTIP